MFLTIFVLSHTIITVFLSSSCSPFLFRFHVFFCTPHTHTHTPIHTHTTTHTTTYTSTHKHTTNTHNHTLVDFSQLVSETTTTRLRQVVRCFCLVTGRSSPVVDMSLHGEHGAAWRRRQRRLRSWWRHEQQSVAMALSAAAHHSFDKVATGETYFGLRAQNMDRAEAAHNAPRRQTKKSSQGA